MIIAVAVLGGFVALAAAGRWSVLGNFGFGPDWHCTYPGRGGPVCLQDPPRPPGKPPRN
jgi:hypothetical protein